MKIGVIGSMQYTEQMIKVRDELVALRHRRGVGGELR